MAFSYQFSQDLPKFLNSPPPEYMNFSGSLHPVTEQGGVIKAHSLCLEEGNSNKLCLLVLNRDSWGFVRPELQFD